MDKARLKQLQRSNWYVYRLTVWLINLYAKFGGLTVSKSSGVKLRKYVMGKGNSFVAGKNCLIDNLFVKIVGNNNSIELGSNVTMRKNCTLMILGNNCKIIIGDNTSMTHHCQIEVQEENQQIVLGNDCMLSNNILIRNNDSHFIYDATTGERSNNPKCINIGNHVWIGAGATILKGVTISDGAVVGTHSIVTHDVPAGSIVSGIPAKVVKENIEWTRSAR